MTLNPDQFFHGTTHNIKGGTVRPANDVGKTVSEYAAGDPGNLSGGDHAFAIRNDERYAWHAASTFHRKGGRARVYEVEPAGDMKPGPWNKEHPNFQRHLAEQDVSPAQIGATKSQDEWASRSGFKVKSQIDTMPGRQGTFPTINWNQFKKSPSPSNPDANHPDDNQIKWGGLGGLPDDLDVARATPRDVWERHDWAKDPAPHSELREMAGRPQRRWATLF